MPHPTLYFVRHGQSEWNLAGRTQGQVRHPALTALGRAQAELAARRIADDLPPGVVPRIITSDLVRAEQTAEVIAAALGGVAVRRDVRLREQHLGRLEGLPHEESWALAEQHDWSDPKLAVAGGESPDQLRCRMKVALTEALRDAAAGPVILVTHGDALRSVLDLIDGAVAPGDEWVAIPNGTVLRCGDSVRWWR